MVLGAGLQVVKWKSVFLMLAGLEHWEVVTARPYKVTVYLELGKRVLMGENSALWRAASYRVLPLVGLRDESSDWQLTWGGGR